MHYTIQFKNAALKELKKLPKIYAGQIAQDVNALAHNPRPIGHKKLKGYVTLYRIRSGNYRIVYDIEDKILTVLVVRIGDRKEVYRNL